MTSLTNELEHVYEYETLKNEPSLNYWQPRRLSQNPGSSAHQTVEATGTAGAGGGSFYAESTEVSEYSIIGGNVEFFISFFFQISRLCPFRKSLC